MKSPILWFCSHLNENMRRPSPNQNYVSYVLFDSKPSTKERTTGADNVLLACVKC